MLLSGLRSSTHQVRQFVGQHGSGGSEAPSHDDDDVSRITGSASCSTIPRHWFRLATPLRHRHCWRTCRSTPAERFPSADTLRIDRRTEGQTTAAVIGLCGGSMSESSRLVALNTDRSSFLRRVACVVVSTIFILVARFGTTKADSQQNFVVARVDAKSPGLAPGEVVVRMRNGD